MGESAPPQAEPSRRGRRAGVAAAAFVLVAVAAWFSVSVLPRWWAQRVGDQVEGDLTTGALLGFVLGFIATLLPLAVLGMVFRFFRRSVKAWVAGALIALVLAAPNLVTLGIVVGRGDAAHAADRTLDVEAPYFRGGMALGAAVAFVLAGSWLWTARSRRRERRRAEEAERRLAEERGRRDPEAAPASAPDDGPSRG